jgi:hypothetical protein
MEIVFHMTILKPIKTRYSIHCRSRHKDGGDMLFDDIPSTYRSELLESTCSQNYQGDDSSETFTKL